MNGGRNTVRPVKWGPGTDGPVWSEGRGRWVLPLNAHGRAVAQGFLDKYRGVPELSVTAFGVKNKGLRGVSWSGPFLLRQCKAWLGEDETRSVAHDAVTRASANYDPARFGCTDAGYTYLANAVYLTLKRAAEVAIRRAENNREVQAEPLFDDQATDGLDLTPGREPDPSAGAEAGEMREAVNRAAGCLTERERDAVRAYYLRGLTYRRVGRDLGLTGTRGEQIVKAAVEKLRRAVSGESQNTPGDGTTMPPHRRQRCQRNRRSAVTR